MSTNLNYKQVANVERRTWDLEAYEKRAKERAKNEEEDGSGDKKKKKKKKVAALNTLGPQVEDDELKEEFQPAAKGAAGPEKSERAFLKARRNRVDVDSKIGSIEIVNPDAVATTKSVVGEPGSVKDGVTKTGVGWHCRVCDCFLRDSHTYLDHINGRKHQKNLGYSMRVERSTKDQVSSRLAQLAKEKEKAKKILVDDREEYFHDVVKAKDEEAQRRREERAKERKERRKMKKLMAQQGEIEKDESEENEELKEVTGDDAEEEEVEEEGINPDLAAMMGFSGFGGGNKNS
mmetsp:Transcript_108175/g.312614  ORF Transcript_108175/g.312614 Transcript_108175/m.312614 type:complete len:291 (+) Transcript_108175:19-891(+)